VTNGIRRARLVEKAGQKLRVVTHFGLQHLDGDPAADARVLGQIDRAHASLAKKRQRLIVTVAFADHAGRV
jgi:hypothetical protein